MRKSVFCWIGLGGLTVFVVFTVIVACVDVGDVGLAHLNHAVWETCGASAVWRGLTDWLGYVVLAVVLGLGVWQIVQWGQRKSLRRIDRHLWALDAVLVALLLVYLFFEIVVVNYRPDFGDAVAKASYPSSHALLFATLLPVFMQQVWHYVPNRPGRVIFTVVLSVVLVLGVVGRLLSGVHWLTDIVGGVLMGAVLNCLYAWLVCQ